MKKISIKHLIIIFLLLFDCFASQLFLPIIDDNSLSVFLIFINVIIIGALLFKDEKQRNLKAIIFVGFLFRMALLLFDIFGREIFVLPNSGMDSENFYRIALEGSFSTLQGYSLWLKLLISLFGDQRIFIQFSNVILYLLSSLILLKIFQKLKLSQKACYFGILIFAFLPSTIIIFSILLREPFMIFLNLLSFYFFVSWFQSHKTRQFVFSVFCCLFSAYFHSSMILLLLVYVFTLIFYNYETEKFCFTRKSVTLTLCSVLGLYFLYRVFGSFVLQYFSNLNSIQELNEKMQWYIDGGSTYLAFTANANSVFQMVLYSPLKLLYFYFSPMIWDFRGVYDLLTFLCSSLFYIYIFIQSLHYRKSSPMQKILLYIILLLGIVHGMSCFSAGAAMRHREKILPFFVICFAMISDGKKSTNKKGKRESYEEYSGF